MQLLFDVSLEDGEHQGLGLIPGRIVRFDPEPGLKVPHMGWNTLRVRRPSPLLEGLEANPSVYFVHSYYARPDNPEHVVAESVHHLAEQALSVTQQPVRASAWQQVPSTYLVCTGDRGTPVDRQRDFSGRATRVVEFDSGHHPFLSHPDAVADVITSFG